MARLLVALEDSLAKCLCAMGGQCSFWPPQKGIFNHMVLSIRGKRHFSVKVCFCRF